MLLCYRGFYLQSCKIWQNCRYHFHRRIYFPKYISEQYFFRHFRGRSINAKTQLTTINIAMELLLFFPSCLSACTPKLAKKKYGHANTRDQNKQNRKSMHTTKKVTRMRVRFSKNKSRQIDRNNVSCFYKTPPHFS